MRDKLDCEIVKEFLPTQNLQASFKEKKNEIFISEFCLNKEGEMNCDPLNLDLFSCNYFHSFSFGYVFIFSASDMFYAKKNQSFSLWV